MRSKLLIGAVLAFCFVTAVIAVRAEQEEIIDNSQELFKQVRLFTDSITLISAEYVKPLKVKDLIYGAIRGMMGTLDGYSQFLTPESFKEITEETKGEFGGLGIEIGIRDGVLTVITPMEGTPAYEAGLMSGDKIVKIDGEITRDMTLDEAVKKLRGKPGTEVSISVIRENTDEMLDFTIKRAVIKLESIKKVEVLEGDIGYISIVEFQERTGRDLKENIKKLIKSGAASLIIDLRNNPGGLLDAAVESADLFLDQGEMIVYTEGRDPKKRLEFISKKKASFGGMDLVVLVNKGSASASEIFAGAMQDNKRGVVVGVTTFGKGSVQTVIPLSDKSALRLTTSAYFTPSGRSLMEKGIDPDIYVEKVRAAGENAEAEEKEKKKAGIFEKVEKAEKEEEEKEPGKYDNQLQTAVSILKGARVFEEYRASRSRGEE